MSMAAQDASRVWVQGLLEAIAEHLPANEAACLRYVSKQSAQLLKGRSTVQLSQRVPPWAFAKSIGPRSLRRLNREQRDRVVCLVAATDVVPNLEVVLSAAGLTPGQLHLEAAARAGALASCAWLVAPGRMTEGVAWAGALCAAAEAGQRAACGWCLERFPGLRAPAGAGAAALPALERGHTELAEWLLEAAGPQPGSWQSPSEREKMLACLWVGCDLATAQRLCGRYRYEIADQKSLLLSLGAALHSEKADWQAKAEWLLGRGAQMHPCMLACDPPLSDAAAVERLIWLVAKGFQPDAWAVAVAVKAGRAAALEWLLAEGVQGGEQHMAQLFGLELPALPGGALVQVADILPLVAPTAAGAGQVGVLSVLHRADSLAQAAAMRGQLQCLQWVLANLQWDRRQGLQLFLYAARSGSVAVMRWVLRETRCGTHPLAWTEAVHSGCEAAVELLAELGCPGPATGQPYVAAVRSRDWRLLRLLHAKRVPLGPPGLGLVVRAIQAGAPAAVLQWLVAEAGCREVDWCAALAAAEEQCEALRCSGPRHAKEVLTWVRARQGWYHWGRRSWLQLRSAGGEHAAPQRSRQQCRRAEELVRRAQCVRMAAGVCSLGLVLAASWVADPGAD